ncbi:hypothetical protein ABV23_RS02355 [Escherichia coli]|nr:hypothetical protein [Escherichia coli]
MAELKSIRFNNNGVVNSTIYKTSTITVTYDPVDWYDQTGKWVYDSTYIKVLYRSGEKLIFKTLKEGNTNISFSPTNYDSLKQTCTVDIHTDTVQSISLNPTENMLKYSSEFEIDVTYNPPIGTDLPTWTYDKNVLTYDAEKSTRDKAFFKVNSSVLSPVSGKITCTYGVDLSAESFYYVSENPASRVKLSPDTSNVLLGDTFSVNILYDPLGCDKTGVWSYDDTCLEYNESRSTSDVAYFKAIKTPEGNNDTLKLTYKCASSVSDSTTCTISYDPLQSVKLTTIPASLNPDAMINVKAGDGFSVKVTYVPDTARHDGVLNFNPLYFTYEKDQSAQDTFLITPILPSIDTDEPVQPISFTSNGIISNILNFTIDYSDLVSVSFDPPEVNTTAGSVFGVTVIYNPSTAKNDGEWNIANVLDYIKKGTTVGDSTSFQSLKATVDSDGNPSSIDMVYKSGYISTPIKCNIDYSELKSINVKCDPSYPLNTSLGIIATYTPDTAKHDGVWTCSSDLIPGASTPDLGSFRTGKLVNAKSVVTVTSKSNKDIGASCGFTSTYSKLKGITVTPLGTTTVKPGDSFGIQISYNPNTAQHLGMYNWDFNPDYFEYNYELSEPNKDIQYFNALLPTPEEGSVLTCLPPEGSGATSGKCVITVSYPPIKSVSIEPPESTHKFGDVFNLIVKYDPDTARKMGTWEYDKDRIALVNPVTDLNDQATFYVINNGIGGETDISYSYYPGVTATHKCTVEYENLDTLSLVPPRIKKKPGNTFYIKIIYTPDGALHDGTWTYNKTVFEYTQESTKDLGVFKISDTAPEGAYQLSYQPKTADPDQTFPPVILQCTITK